ncbi:MAG: M48 family metalloprotease [Alphaproteobacteria bacterium]|nr:M48 family metalloprotease [Alphaproteobacteria bacterium]
MAHEIGHIAGGHLARLHSAIERAGKAAFITQILGLAVGALAQNPAGAAAIISGGQHVAGRSFLNYSRGQEQSADQAAARYLDRVGISGKGLLEFLNILSGQEFLQTSNQDPYIRSHPLTRSRISFMENHVAKSPATNKKLPPQFVERHLRLVAKLDGFLDAPERTLEKYKANDTSIPARYARAIATYRLAELSKALPLIESLISDFPKNPYFVELKAQMLFENGRLKEAMKSYQKAVRLLPDAPLIRTSLAHVILEMNQPELNDLALANIKEALRVERFMPLAWRLAGTAYGRKKQFGLSAWSLAEYNVLIGRKQLARVQVERALKILKVGTPSWLRAQDIKNEIDRKK